MAITEAYFHKNQIMSLGLVEHFIVSCWIGSDNSEFLTLLRARCTILIRKRGRWGHLIIVVGLAFEARIAAGPGIHVVCSGNGRNLTTTLTAAIAEARRLFGSCPGIVSFGVAGGLSPQLRPGDCVIGSAILSGSSRLPTNHMWSEKLLRSFPDAVSGMIVGVSAPVSDPDDKRKLHLNTGAVAVDMESHIVAAVGAAHGLPVAAMRVITDPAKRALPASAVAAMRPNGTTSIGAMIRSVLMRPREIPALFQTALDALAARATLVRGRHLLGPVLLRVESVNTDLIAADDAYLESKAAMKGA
jgi:adenosylhomocysteine nucleosidase